METLTFKGFGGVRLQAEVWGEANDPTILLVHGAGQTREVWRDVAEGLVSSGRRVVSLDMRGHGASEWVPDGRYGLTAHVEDMRAVLAQLGTRPVVVAALSAGWVVTAALADDAANLAAGLVLVDMPVDTDAQWVQASVQKMLKAQAEGKVRFDPNILRDFQAQGLTERLLEAAPRLNLPTMVTRRVRGWTNESELNARFDSALPQGEINEVDDSEAEFVTDRQEVFLSRLLDFLDRKQPRAANEFRAGSDARTLRDAMGCFATGITVVTARDAEGNPVGLTANSFTSVSLDPPLLLICIANTSGNAPILREATHFGVNVLQTSQQDTSNRFAGRGVDRFASTPWHSGEGDVPLLDGSLVSFECRHHALHEGGDHFILVGEVLRAQFEPRRDPLLYFRGKYRRLHFA